MHMPQEHAAHKRPPVQIPLTTCEPTTLRIVYPYGFSERQFPGWHHVMSLCAVEDVVIKRDGETLTIIPTFPADPAAQWGLA